jgi:hypothetical protein
MGGDRERRSALQRSVRTVLRRIKDRHSRTRDKLQTRHSRHGSVLPHFRRRRASIRVSHRRSGSDCFERQIRTHRRWHSEIRDSDAHAPKQRRSVPLQTGDASANACANASTHSRPNTLSHSIADSGAHSIADASSHTIADSGSHSIADSGAHTVANALAYTRADSAGWLGVQRVHKLLPVRQSSTNRASMPVLRLDLQRGSQRVFCNSQHRSKRRVSDARADTSADATTHTAWRHSATVAVADARSRWVGVLVVQQLVRSLHWHEQLSLLRHWVCRRRCCVHRQRQCGAIRSVPHIHS